VVPRKPRRRPRYAGFLVTGGVIGLVADVVVVLGPGADAQSRSQLFLFLALLLVGTGALLGGLLAVLIEGRVPRPPRDRDDAPGDAARTTADP
jgi:NhaP-type Na+/H+ or K+/H+ antiporter